MFRKLRNKFIFFNFGITSVIILVVFSSIYFSASRSANRRPQIERTPPFYTSEIKKIVTDSVNSEREKASKELLFILIISGLFIEFCVVLISYFLAEIAIKPIKEAYDSQKLFIANASHEIKTPLAAISANLEAANIKNNKWIKNIEDETLKITTLNNNLLKLAKADLVTDNSNITKENLKTLIEKELKNFMPRIQSSQKPISVQKHIKSLTAEINKTDFCEVVNILLDNAIKYCDSQIIISLNESRLEIKNDGKLIPKEKLPHVFNRFYQVDKTNDGVGLGLSIAASLAERNHWQLSATTEDKFNIFTIAL